MFIALASGEALHRQVYRQLREAIVTGHLAPGYKLPSSRQLAVDAGVSRKTTVVALEQLLAEGYVETRAGSGTYVTQSLPDPQFQTAAAAEHVPAGDDAPRLSRFGSRISSVITLAPTPPQPRPRFDFRYGAVSALDFPYKEWKKLTARALLRSRSSGLPLEYGDPQGLVALRKALAGYLQRARGIVADPSQIVIVNGSQQAIDISARILLDAGDGVVIEEPAYYVARTVFEALGATLIPIPVDSEGLDIRRLASRGRRPKLVYFTPSHQFPTGAVMPVARRLQMLEWAARHDAYLVEDDYDGEFRYVGRPIPAVQSLDRRHRVIFVGTVSKTLSPTLRLGYVVLPPSLVPAFVKAKILLDRHTATHLQVAFAEFIAEGSFEQHVRKARRKNELRRNLTIARLQSTLGDAIEIQGSKSGLHLLLWLKKVAARECDPIVAEAAKFGVGIYPVTPHYLEPPRRAGFVIGYAGLELSQITAGVELLAQAIRSYARMSRRR